MKKRRNVSIIGVPLDLGANRPGARHGPAAIRKVGLISGLRILGLEVFDLGDINVPQAKGKTNSKARQTELIFKVCQQLEEKVSGVLQSGSLPIILGGDHSLSMGSVAGSADFFAKRGQRIGLLWADAHGDINTPDTSPSGNLHGMPVASILGLWRQRRVQVKPKNVCLLGTRDLDPGEKKNIASSGVNIFTMEEVDKRGISKVFEQALQQAGKGTAGVHLSFDIDVIDPSVAAGVSTPSRGGLTYREAHLLMELLADSGRLVSLDMVEVNSVADRRNQTAALACELILSALGKKIY